MMLGGGVGREKSALCRILVRGICDRWSWSDWQMGVSSYDLLLPRADLSRSPQARLTRGAGLGRRASRGACRAFGQRSCGLWGGSAA